MSVVFFALHRQHFRAFSIPKVYGYFPKVVCKGRLVIGKRCNVTAYRLKHVLASLQGAELEIGDDAFINDGVNICASQSIKIGKSVKIGDMTFIYDSDFHSVSSDATTKTRPVVIGDNVWIGANCMVLAGSVIGDHAVIAAGSIVSGAVPAKSLAAGRPAAVKRVFDVEDGWIRT